VDGVKVISYCQSKRIVCNATVNVASSLIAVNLINLAVLVFHHVAWLWRLCYNDAVAMHDYPVREMDGLGL
jgi:hypothetical protein